MTMDIWHKETTPGTTGSRCTIRDGSGLFVAECVASDAAMVAAAPAMLTALHKMDGWLSGYGTKDHREIHDELRAFLAEIGMPSFVMGGTPTTGE